MGEGGGYITIIVNILHPVAEATLEPFYNLRNILADFAEQHETDDASAKLYATKNVVK